MKKLFLLFYFVGMTGVFAQPAIEWQKSYGGSSSDSAYSIIQNSDGDYVIAGLAFSNDGDVTGNHGSNDFWIIKINSEGVLLWQKAFGGSDIDEAYSISQVEDGGYIVAGSSRSSDGDLSENKGLQDFWIVKLDNMGEMEWQKSLGGTGDDVAYSAKQTTDGGYIVAGFTESNNGDVTNNNGKFDYWVVKLDSNGILEWQKTLGGIEDDKAYSVLQTIDGGYIVAGYTNSNNGDVSGNHGGWDIWVVKLNNIGDIQWQKAFGGSSLEITRSIIQTPEGDFIIAGASHSNDGDVSGNHGDGDFWIFKINETGSILWQNSLGGTLQETSHSAFYTQDNGVIAAGRSRSNDGDVSHNYGSNDYWVVKLDYNGELQWQKPLGGSNNDVAMSVIQDSDLNYLIAGMSVSNDGDVTNNHGGHDFWIVKLNSNIGIEEFYTGIRFYPNPVNNTLHIKTANHVVDTVKIYSATGALIEIFEVNTITPVIDVSSLATGVYFVHLHSGKKMAAKKFIKE